MAQVKSKNMGKDMSLCVIACSYKKKSKVVHVFTLLVLFSEICHDGVIVS